MKFSVIIPAKNEETVLPVLFSSIKRQTLQPTEVIVADAQSEDRTREVASAMGARVVQGGLVAVGRNAGAGAVTTDVLFFLDADVELTDEQFFEKALQEFEDRSLDVATADVHPLSTKRSDHFVHSVYNRYVRMCGSRFPHAPGFCILVRRSLHEQIDGFDESITFCEDHDYVERAAKHGTFGILNSVKIPVSVRRFSRDGRLRTWVKFIFGELHLRLLGPIRHHRFNYTFGHEPHEKEDQRKQ